MLTEDQVPQEPQKTSESELTASAVSKNVAEQYPGFVGQTTTPPVVDREAKQNIVDDLPPGPVPLTTVNLTAEYTSPELDMYERTDLSLESEIAFFHSEASETADARIRRHFTPTGIRTDRGRDWNEALVTASTTTAFRNRALVSTVQNPACSWMQYLNAENGKIGFTSPALKENTNSYTGEKAMLRVRSLLGMGGIVSIPMYHSGFWVTVSAPSDGALLELRRRLQQEKIDLGRMTFGLLYSNEQSYLNSWMYEFCMEHIYDTNVRVDNPAVELRDLIKVQDLNILFWGLACLVWPRGFDYIRPLTTVEGVENYQTISAKINVSKLMWVDNNSFTKEQTAMLSRRQRGSVTVEEVKKYQENFLPSLAQGRRVAINDNLALIISSPNVTDYIEDGEVWISNIVRAVDSTFTTTAPDDQQRAIAIEQHSRAARLRNYGAWIKAVVIEDREIAERDVVYGTLEVLSQDNALSKIVQDAVNKFIDDSTRALIAIPATNGKESGVPRFANLIPMDVINTFFTLLAQRAAIISRR